MSTDRGSAACPTGQGTKDGHRRLASLSTEISIAAAKRSWEARCPIMKLLFRCWIFKWEEREHTETRPRTRRRCHLVPRTAAAPAAHAAHSRAARPPGRPLAFRDRTGCGAKPSSRAASAALLKLRRTRSQRPLHRKMRAENISVIAQNFYQTALVRKGGRAAPRGPNQACRLFV